MDNVLTCGMEEGEAAHTHSDACFVTETVLSCGMEEGEGAHTHTDACYETQRVLSCGQEESEGRTHTDACYETQRVLSCGREELQEHVHTVDCFQVVDKSPEEIEAMNAAERPESDPFADVETADMWESRFDKIDLPGHWDEDLLKLLDGILHPAEA